MASTAKTNEQLILEERKVKALEKIAMYLTLLQSGSRISIRQSGVKELNGTYIVSMKNS